MAKYTRNSGKHWTPAEERQLRKMATENTPTRVIGLKLGRPRGRRAGKGLGEEYLAEANESVSLQPPPVVASLEASTTTSCHRDGIRIRRWRTAWRTARAGAMRSSVSWSEKHQAGQ